MDLRTPVTLAPVADDKPDEWPRGLRRAYHLADPADPTLPPAPVDPSDTVTGRLARKLPRYDDPALKPVQFAEVYARLLALSVARVEFLGSLLAQAYDDLERNPITEPPVDRDDDEADDEADAGHDDYDAERDLGRHEKYNPGVGDGIRALVGDTYDLTRYGSAVATGEKVRALVELEAAERDRAARLVKDAIRIGLQAKQVDVMRSYGHTVVASMRALCERLGIDWAEPATREAARDAIITARSRLGAEVLTARNDDDDTPR